MKKGVLFLVLVIFMMLSAYISFAAVPDSDQDGVPDAQDKCPNSQSTVVDQFGCTCAQKTANNCASLYSGAQCCASDNNPCTDDCAADNVGKAVCNYVASVEGKSCTGGRCSHGNCVQITTTTAISTTTSTISPTSWPTATPKSQGMSSDMLRKIPSNVIDDAIVIRNGFEVWHWGDVINSRGAWSSVTRSYLTTAWGMAIQDGSIPGGLAILDKPVRNLPSSTARDYDSDVLLKHMLSYTSCANPSGSSFSYSCGQDWFDQYQIFKEITGKTVHDYLNKKLFTKLRGDPGLDAESYNEDPRGETNRVSGSPSDHARWGYLWLNGGNWNGQQLVDSAFVQRSISSGPNPDEGWQIHLYRTDGAEFIVPGCPKDLFMAAGGEDRAFIIVSPSLNLVVARWTNSPGNPPKNWMGQICQAVVNNSVIRNETHSTNITISSHKTDFLTIPDGQGENHFTVMFAGQSSSTRAKILSDLKSRGYTHLYLSPMNEGDFAGFNNFKKFNFYNQNPSQFKAILQEVVNAGLKPVVWLALDDAPNFHRDSAQKLPGIWNTFIPAIDGLVDSYVLGLESDEYWSLAEQNVLGNKLNSLTNKPIFLHPGSDKQRITSWMDGIIYQWSQNSRTTQKITNTVKSLVPQFHNQCKFFIAGEYAHQVSESEAKSLGDAAMAAGADGFGNGGTSRRWTSSSVSLPNCSNITTTSPCKPRPACLDSVPACKIAEPVGGWCPIINETACNLSTQPFPHWNWSVKYGKCLKSCGMLGGTYCSPTGVCPLPYGLVPDGPSYDCRACCKSSNPAPVLKMQPEQIYPREDVLMSIRNAKPNSQVYLRISGNPSKIGRSDNTGNFSKQINGTITAGWIAGSTMEFQVIIGGSESNYANVRVLCDGSCPINLPQDYFTFIVIPDTQVYSDPIGYGADYSKSFTDITNWIAKNFNGLKIKMVAHVGDVVDDSNQSSQWNIATNAMRVLDNAGVPYGILAGNHDFDISPSRTETFARYFPVSRYSQNSWWGGSSDSYNSNSYTLFSGGGESYVLISLRYTTPNNKEGDAIWANSIIKKYPSRKIIISTHAYLNYQGLRQYQNQAEGGPITSYEHLWTDIAYPNSNVFMMISGHDMPKGEAYRIDKNIGEQNVYQLLSNYQSNGKGGHGRLRKMTFAPSQNKIYAQTIATSLNRTTCVDGAIGKNMVYRTDGCYETDSNSEFIIDLTSGAIIPGPFELKLP